MISDICRGLIYQALFSILLLLPLNLKASDNVFKVSSVRIEIASAYDDNILRYSNNDLDKFVNNIESSPSRLSTYDDWKNELSLKAYFRSPRFFQNNLRISYFAKIASYYRNPFNNYSTHTLLIDQKLSKKWETHFKYFLIPEYYLREYRDRDTNEYHSCQFTDRQTRLGVTYSLLRETDLTLQAQFEQLYYNQYFTEYDCEGKLLEFETVHNFSSAFRGSVNLGLALYDNIGYTTSSSSGAVVFGEDTEYGDGSYREEIYQANLRYRLPVKSENRSTLSVEYKLRHRIYTTNNTLQQDPFHAGRGDDRHRIILDFEQEFTAKITAGLSYTHEWRDTHSDYPPTVDAKSFKQNVIELTIGYRLY
jgi:hypothetical protein